MFSGVGADSLLSPVVFSTWRGFSVFLCRVLFIFDRFLREVEVINGGQLGNGHSFSSPRRCFALRVYWPNHFRQNFFWPFYKPNTQGGREKDRRTERKHWHPLADYSTVRYFIASDFFQIFQLMAPKYFKRNGDPVSMGSCCWKGKRLSMLSYARFTWVMCVCVLLP